VNAANDDMYFNALLLVCIVLRPVKAIFVIIVFLLFCYSFLFCSLSLWWIKMITIHLFRRLHIRRFLWCGMA